MLIKKQLSINEDDSKNENILSFSSDTEETFENELIQRKKEILSKKTHNFKKKSSKLISIKEQY